MAYMVLGIAGIRKPLPVLANMAGIVVVPASTRIRVLRLSLLLVPVLLMPMFLMLRAFVRSVTVLRHEEQTTPGSSNSQLRATQDMKTRHLPQAPIRSNPPDGYSICVRISV